MTQRSASDSLIPLFAEAGYPHRDVGMLHPADVFLELSGEDIRRRLYLTQDATGRDMCLRPEFTIPLCMEIAASGERSAAMSYCGPVFRQRDQEPGEFVQAGVESVGRADSEAADAEILALALSAAQELGGRDLHVRLGDSDLIQSVLAGLQTPPAFARRLKRKLAAGKSVAEALAATTGSGQDPDHASGLSAALGSAGPSAARALVMDMLAMNGLRAAGGRSAEDIADRFLAKAQEGAGSLADGQIESLRAFLSIEGHPDQVLERMRVVARDAGFDISAALTRYERRLGFMAAQGIDLSMITASARFVRSLDYYTGMVFEITDPQTVPGKPLIGGGRYDGLLKRLGAATDVPAVGFSLWVERFRGAR
jgi:ATP phosphoribosyltransferase regulatory subunit